MAEDRAAAGPIDGRRYRCIDCGPHAAAVFPHGPTIPCCPACGRVTLVYGRPYTRRSATHREAE